MKIKAIKFLYQKIMKPIYFRIDPEKVHNHMTGAMKHFGKNKVFQKTFDFFFSFKHLALKQHISGLKFDNPIGLAAGFDYDAKWIGVLPHLGFGFHTVGTITNEPYEGNEKPRLGRLPKSKSLLVNKGFKSAGMDKNLRHMKYTIETIPLGISIGSTNKKYNSLEDQAKDVVEGFRKAINSRLGSYYELNISCPNLSHVGSDADSFSSESGFKMLLELLSSLQFNKPIFVKMHLEKSIEGTRRLMEIAKEHNFIKGFIFSNLCKDRSNPHFDKEEIEKAGKGNFSGKPTSEQSLKLIRFAYKNYKERFIIIGCGGIFSAEDAYKKIKAGASLVQMITGMIYEGPQIISEINQDLVNLLEEDGYKSISDAIGTEHQKLDNTDPDHHNTDTFNHT
ncbi:MAG: quinone-dependent dihydroorotate dehydrogenase [Candidatus Magasanikbacteria bacterium]